MEVVDKNYRFVKKDRCEVSSNSNLFKNNVRSEFVRSKIPNHTIFSWFFLLIKFKNVKIRTMFMSKKSLNVPELMLSEPEPSWIVNLGTSLNSKQFKLS